MSQPKKQHIIPAVLISQFSIQRDNPNIKARNKAVWVKNKNGKVYFQKASEILKKKNYYGNQQSLNIDSVWTEYEKNLQKVIRAITKAEMTFELYFLLCSFCAQIFVRTDGFKKEFTDRLLSVFETEEKIQEVFDLNENINVSRLIEFSRLFPLFFYAKIVVYQNNKEGIIGNDIGYYFVNDRNESERAGIAFPLTSSLVVVFYFSLEEFDFNKRKKQLDKEKRIHRKKLDSDSLNDFNKVCSRYANKLIFGCQKKYVHSVSLIEETPPPIAYLIYKNEEEFSKVKIILREHEGLHSFISSTFFKEKNYQSIFMINGNEEVMEDF